MLVNTSQQSYKLGPRDWKTSTGFSESSRNTSSQLPKVWSRDVNPESTLGLQTKADSGWYKEEEGTSFLGFSVS